MVGRGLFSVHAALRRAQIHSPESHGNIHQDRSAASWMHVVNTGGKYSCNPVAGDMWNRT
jgi:hypothetical protein